MLSTALTFAISLAIAAVLTPIAREFAIRRNLAVAAPRTDRDVHTSMIPRIGGVAIVIGFMVPLVGLVLMDSGVARYIQRDPEWMSYVIALFGGGTVIAMLGLYDDVKGANAYQKLAVQIAVATFVWILGIRIDVLGAFGVRLETGYLSLPLTIFWIVIVINALNLIDGLDGLAGGVAVMAVLPNLVIAIRNENVVMMVLMAALCGSILGFLIYNFRPASVFMGDTGSMFLGFVLSTGSILGNAKASATVSMIAPVLALGLPIMDTLLAVFRRSMAGVPLFVADSDHLHHRLIKRGFTHKQSVLVMYGFSFLLAAGALASAFMRGPQGAGLILVVVCIAGFFMRTLGYLSWTRISRGRAGDLRMAIRAVCADVRQMRDLTAIWRAIEPVRTILPVASVELAIGEERFSWESASAPSSGTSRFDLFAERESVGQIRIGWQAPVRNEEETTAVALVGDAIGEALARMRRPRVTPNVIPLRGGRDPDRAA